MTPSAAAHSAPANAARHIAHAGAALTFGYGVFLLIAFLHGQWLIDGDGNPLASDFSGMWSAGQSVLDGDPAAAYAWAFGDKIEAVQAGRAAGTFYPWIYPPRLLFTATLFALLPAIPATIAWLAVTVPVYALAVAALLRTRGAIFIALGFPAALWNVAQGGNALFTAAALAGGLGLLERWPILAGICFSIMLDHPHLGAIALIPLALIVGGYWRALLSAVIVTALLAAVTFFVFGPETTDAFVRAMPAIKQLNLELGGPGFDQWQSPYGVARALQASTASALTIHFAICAGVAAVIVAIWRGAQRFDLKAGALAADLLLATPYLLIDDLALLVVAVAFLLRDCFSRGFDRVDLAGLAAVTLLLLGYNAFIGAGLVAVAIVFALILRRAFTPDSSADIAAVSR